MVLKLAIKREEVIKSMKAIRILGRSIKDAFKSVFRNFSLSIASITCIAITLILVAIGLVISENINHFTDNLEKELSIVVYLNEGTTEEQAEDIQNKIKAMASYEDLTFKSKEEWKVEMQGYSEDLNTTLAYLDTNPLLDSIVVKVKNIDELKSTSKAIAEIDGVKSAKYGEDTVDQMVVVFRVVEKATIILVIALILVTSFLISNTIKLTIYSRRSEIEIMRLVGTSNTVIKLPFIFEGLFLGIIGSIIPILLSLYGYIILYDHFNGHLFSHMVELVTPMSLIPKTALILFIIGGVVGMLGSWHAVRKYLKI
jgi:cell division transport system permease protein